MHISESALSLNVPDVEASARWAEQHLGFARQMSADGFASLSHPEAGFSLIYLRTGLETFKPASAAGTADGLLVVFVVDDVDEQYARLQQEGATHRHADRDGALGRALLPDGRPERGRLPAGPVDARPLGGLTPPAAREWRDCAVC